MALCGKLLHICYVVEPGISNKRSLQLSYKKCNVSVWKALLGCDLHHQIVATVIL